MLRATAAAKKDYSELSREWKWDSIISQDTRLPSDKSALVDEPFVDPHGPRASISGNSEVRFERKQQTHVSHDAFFPEKPEDWRIDVEDGSQAQVPINKLLDNLSLGLSQYSASEEDSKTLVSDKVQWHLDYEQEIPLAIKQHVLRYKQANDGPMRLERQINGTEGVLCYILKHSLLIWLYRENTTLEQDFGEEIHSVRRKR